MVQKGFLEEVELEESAGREEEEKVMWELRRVRGGCRGVRAESWSHVEKDGKATGTTSM